MKCIIFVVMLALAAAHASVLPLAYLNPYAPGISLSQGIAGLYGAPTHVLAHSLTHAPLAYSTHTLVAGPVASTLVAAAAPAPAVLATPTLVAAPSASYVATTRGAQHVAPLPGHAQSVSSNNLQPAPGTL